MQSSKPSWRALLSLLFCFFFVGILLSGKHAGTQPSTPPHQPVVEPPHGGSRWNIKGDKITCEFLGDSVVSEPGNTLWKLVEGHTQVPLTSLVSEREVVEATAKLNHLKSMEDLPSDFKLWRFAKCGG